MFGAMAMLLLLLALVRFGADGDSSSSDYGTKLVADPPVITVIESASTISWDDSVVETEAAEPSTEAPTRKPTTATRRPPPHAERSPSERAPEQQAREEAERPSAPQPTPSRPEPQKRKPRAFLLRTRMVVSKVGSGVPQPSVVAALQHSIKSVELCVEKVVKAAHRQMAGSIPVSAQIDSEGRLRPLNIQTPYAGSEACLRKAYAETDFPRSTQGSSTLEFTLEFETSN